MIRGWAKNNKGFTIVELLIVVVVIAILAAIAFVSYGSIKNRANDSRRAQDIATIEKSLIMYNELNGGVPAVMSYYGGWSNYSGWDTSIDGRWLSFLTPTYGKMPVDPVNTISATNDPSGVGSLSYFYHCYAAGASGFTSQTAVIGYHKQDGSVVRRNIPVTACFYS